MELDSIRASIDAVRRRVRTYYLVHGLGRVALTLAAFVILTYIADYLIPKLPAAVRGAFLLGGVGALGYMAWRHLVYPLGKQIGDDDIALCVERTNPQLKDRLISALQLSRNLGKPGEENFNSPELVKVIVEDALEAAKRVRFFDILTGRIPRGAMVKGCASLLAVTAYFALLQPDHAVVWMQRLLLLRNVPYDPGTRIRFVLDSHQVPKGEKFTATVEAVGSLPLEPAEDANGAVRFLCSAYNFVTGRGKRPQVHLTVKWATGSEEDRERMVADTGSLYHYDILNVRDDFIMKADTVTSETDWISIHAAPSPRIDRIFARYDYPDYTGMKDTPADHPEEGGNLKAPAGTTVIVEADINVPLKEAQLRLTIGREAEFPVPMEIGPRANGPGSTVRGKFRVDADGEYSVFLLSQEDLKSRVNRYSIRSIQDAHPVVKVIEPAMDKAVTQIAVVPLGAMTTDDYGVVEVAFYWIKVGVEGAPTKVLFDHEQNRGDYGTTKIESTWSMDLSSFGAKEGDVIRYWIEAKDNHGPEPHPPTKSKEYNLSVVSKETKESQVEDQLLKLKQELEKNANAQEAEQKRVRDIVQPFSAKDQLTQAEKRQISALTTSQRQLGQRLERLGKEFGEVLKDVEVNKLMDPASKEQLEKVKEMIADVAQQKSPQAAEELSRAETTPKGAERGEKLSAAADRQQEALEELQKALEALGKWEDFQEVVKAWREILLRHKDLMGQIRNK
ncbi:MAG: hypothetical protein AAB434_07280 [Planctomycetota bacterium]